MSMVLVAQVCSVIIATSSVLGVCIACIHCRLDRHIKSLSCCWNSLIIRQFTSNDVLPS